MNEQDQKNVKHPAPESPVEMGEADLDKAAGGASQINDPTADVSWWFAGRKSEPEDPSIGLLNDPPKKV